MLLVRGLACYVPFSVNFSKEIHYSKPTLNYQKFRTWQGSFWALRVRDDPFLVKGSGCKYFDCFPEIRPIPYKKSEYTHESNAVDRHITLSESELGNSRLLRNALILHGGRKSTVYSVCELKIYFVVRPIQFVSRKRSYFDQSIYFGGHLFHHRSSLTEVLIVECYYDLLEHYYRILIIASS